MDNIKSSFGILDFPEDRVFVLLSLQYHKYFWKNVSRISFNELNNRFFEGNLNYNTFKPWRRTFVRKNGIPTLRFMPLWFVIKIAPEFGMDINELEQNIIALKGPSVSTILWYPKLPIPEDERLLRIVAHMLGDGCIQGAFGSGLPKGRARSEYRNFDISLLDKFQEDMKLFGTARLKRCDLHGHIIIPNLIGYLLKSFYGVDFGCFKSKVPDRVFSLNKKLVCSFIRAFADDEGHVYDSSIEIYSCNKRLLSGVLKLINLHCPNIETSKMQVNPSGVNPKFSFNVRANSLSQFSKLVGFDSTIKSKELSYNIWRRKRNNNFRKNKKEDVLDILKEGPNTAKRISRRMCISHGVALDHLNNLKNQGKVRIISKIKWSNVWAKT